MDEDGKRYKKTQSLNELFDDIITEPMHSNMEKTGLDAKV